MGEAGRTWARLARVDRPVVLVLRALGLGDGLTAIPALRGLRRAFGPEVSLVLAAPAGIGAWLAARGVVDEVLVTPDLDDVVEGWRAARGGRRPDVAVDLHGRGPRSHRLLQALNPDRLIAWRCPAAGHLDGPVHDDAEHEVLRWCRLVSSATGAGCGPADLVLPTPARGTLPAGLAPGFVLVHPGAASGSRRWPADRFARLVEVLAAGGPGEAGGRAIVVTGSAAERDLVDVVAGGTAGVRRLAGVLDLDGLAAVVAHAGLVVCGDTGVAHLATAHRVRSVLLFGPTPPAGWGPCVDPDRHRVLWHGPQLAAGSPGGYHGDPHAAAVDPALDRITVAEVLGALAALRAPRQRRPPWGGPCPE